MGNPRRGREGTALLVAVSILTFLSLVGITFVLVSRVERTVAVNRLDVVRARLAAQSGLDMTFARIVDDLQNDTNLHAMPEEQVRRAQPIQQQTTSSYALLNDTYYNESGTAQTDPDGDGSVTTISGQPVQRYVGFPMDNQRVRVSASNDIAIGGSEEDDVPGTYEPLGDKFSLRIMDAQGMINLKSFDTRKPSDFSGTPPTDYDPAQRLRLRMLLINLGEFVKQYINNPNPNTGSPVVADTPLLGINPFDPTTGIVDKLLDELPTIETKQDLREFMNRELNLAYSPPPATPVDYFPLIEPYVTMASWPDASIDKYNDYRVYQNVYYSDFFMGQNKTFGGYTVKAGRLGPPLYLPKNPSNEEGFKIFLTEVRNPVSGRPRSPVNINTATRPVLASLIYGLGARVVRTYPIVTMTDPTSVIERNPLFKYGAGANDYYREVLHFDQRLLADFSAAVHNNTRPPTQGGTSVVFGSKVVEVFPWHDNPNNRSFAWALANALYNRVHPAPPPPPALEPFNPFLSYRELEVFVDNLWDDGDLAGAYRIAPNANPATNLGFIRELPWYPDDTRGYGNQINDWNPYQNGAAFADSARAQEDFKRWYNSVAKAILMANFNPNTRFQFGNPNRHARTPVSKLDLVFRVPESTDTGYIAPVPGGTTEAVFQSGGIYEIASYGEITTRGVRDDLPETDPNFGKIAPGKVAASATIRAYVSLWDVLYKSSQADFLDNEWDFGAGPVSADLHLVRGSNVGLEPTKTTTYPLMLAPQYLEMPGFTKAPIVNHRRTPSKFDGSVELKPRLDGTYFKAVTGGGGSSPDTPTPFSASSGHSFQVTFNPETQDPNLPLSVASGAGSSGRDFTDPMVSTPPAQPFSMPFSGSQFWASQDLPAPYVLPIHDNDPGPGGRWAPQAEDPSAPDPRWQNGFPTALRPDGVLMSPFDYKITDINSLAASGSEPEDGFPDPVTRFKNSQQLLHQKYLVFSGSDVNHFFGVRNYVGLKEAGVDLPAPIPPTEPIIRQFLSGTLKNPPGPPVNPPVTVDTVPGNTTHGALSGPGPYADFLDQVIDRRLHEVAISPYSGVVEFWIKFNDELVNVDPARGNMSGLFIATIPLNYSNPNVTDLAAQDANKSMLNNGYTTYPQDPSEIARATEGVQLICFIDNQGVLRFSRIYYGDIPAVADPANPSSPVNWDVSTDGFIGIDHPNGSLKVPFKTFLSDSPREVQVRGDQNFPWPEVRMYGWGSPNGPPVPPLTHDYASGPGVGEAYPYRRRNAQKWAETHAFVPLVDKDDMRSISSGYDWMSDYCKTDRTIRAGEWHHIAIAWRSGVSYEPYTLNFDPAENPHDPAIMTFADYPFYGKYTQTGAAPAMVLAYPGDGPNAAEVQVWIDGKPRINYSGADKNNTSLVFNYGLNMGDITDGASYTPGQFSQKVIVKTYKKLNEQRPEALLFLNSIVRRQHHLRMNSAGVEGAPNRYNALLKFAKPNAAGEIDPEKPGNFLAQLVSNATTGSFRSYALARRDLDDVPDYMIKDYSDPANGGPPSRFGVTNAGGTFLDPAGSFEQAFVNPYDFSVRVRRVAWTQMLPETNPLNSRPITGAPALDYSVDAGLSGAVPSQLNQKYLLWSYTGGGVPVADPGAPVVDAEKYQQYFGPYVQMDLRTYQASSGAGIPVGRTGYLQRAVSPEAAWASNGVWDVNDVVTSAPLDIPGIQEVAPAGPVNDQRGVLIVRADFRTGGLSPLNITPTLDDIAITVQTHPRVIAWTNEPAGP